MAITAKELAAHFGISATAVSIALNNKPGVSTATRKKIIQYAEEQGYDFSKLSHFKEKHGSIYCIVYHAHNAILNYAPIFNEIIEGMEKECSASGYMFKAIHIYGRKDNIAHCLEDIRISDCIGILLLGTEMDSGMCGAFASLTVPFLIVDNTFDCLNCSSILINNIQAAYTAVDYIISQTGQQPGYLRSSYVITNFSERSTGFEKAVREHGMSVNKSVIHSLPPSIDGAFSDMAEIIDNHTELAKCYFADNDLIAIGAVKAFKSHGYSIPDDIAVIGVDNITESRVIEPQLTTMDIPRRFMGSTAVRQLITEITAPTSHKVKIEIAPELIIRGSV